MNILQFNKDNKNYVGIIENDIVHYINEPVSMHELAKNSIQQGNKLLNYIKNNFTFSAIPYKELLNNYSLSLPMTPEDLNHCFVAQAKFLSGAINSEICIDQLPERFVGKVEIFSQNKEKKWDSEFCTGRSKMVHSLENLESYYFRNNMNLHENDVHFLFLGVDRMSFSDGFTIQPEDEVVISSNTFKTKLTNIIQTIEPKPSVSVKTLY